MTTLKRVCVFCGSSAGANPVYLEAARDLGRGLANAGIGVVYGGASIGLMGALANASLEAGGEVIGVIPQPLDRVEIAHPGLTRLEKVDTLLTRKARMAELSDGFIALPGGGGTLDELFEVFTWAQLGLHQKRIVLFQVLGFFDALLDFVDHAVKEGFIRADQRPLLGTGSSVDDVLSALRHDVHMPGPKAVTRSDL